MYEKNFVFHKILVQHLGPQGFWKITLLSELRGNCYLNLLLNCSELEIELAVKEFKDDFN
jgi:hypothetical protein